MSLQPYWISNIHVDMYTITLAETIFQTKRLLLLIAAAMIVGLDVLTTDGPDNTVSCYWHLAFTPVWMLFVCDCMEILF